MNDLENGWAAGPGELTRWTNGMSRIDQQQRASLAEASSIVRNPLPASTLTYTMGSQMGLLPQKFWLSMFLWGPGEEITSTP